MEKIWMDYRFDEVVEQLQRQGRNWPKWLCERPSVFYSNRFQIYKKEQIEREGGNSGSCGGYWAWLDDED